MISDQKHKCEKGTKFGTNDVRGLILITNREGQIEGV